MFIQTETTPNPATLKFLPGQIVLESGTAEFGAGDDASASPLAERLLRINGVTNVFFGSDFVSITKVDDKDWLVLKPAILGALMEHFSTGQPVIREGEAQATAASGHSAGAQDDPLTQQITEILDTRIRPAVAQDGGDVVFDSFEDGVVYLHMRGACSGCPSAAATLKVGIENMLRHYVPEVVEVRPVE